MKEKTIRTVSAGMAKVESDFAYGLTMKRENDVGGIKTLPDHPDEGGDLNQL